MIAFLNFELKDKHFFTNPFLSSTDGYERYASDEWILTQIKALTYKVVNRIILLDEKLTYNIYSGLGGIVYALLRAHKYLNQELSDENGVTNGAAFYYYLDGFLGINVTKAIFHYIKKESFDISATITTVVNILMPEKETIFDGRCGQLASILTLQKEANQFVLDENEIHKVLTKVINTGYDCSVKHLYESPLAFPESNYSGKHSSVSPLPYPVKLLGFLKGLAGILQMLLSFWNYLDDNKKSLVKDTVEWLLEKYEVDKASSSAEKDEMKDIGELCQLWIVAYIVLDDEKYLNAADACCEQIWERGISCEGPGLDNGVSGNGYAFLLMYRLTKNEKYLSRSKMFSLILMDPEFDKLMKESENPFSLFEGWSGALCFLTDILDPKNAQFPFIPISFPQ
uniref:Uncharacterized protein n=1 Tax=Panagrolaimus davidi TaxID=227884 RepID=A0A914NZS6_9BILA